MGKPRLIILVRHAQSEGNKNRDIHQTTPDHRVKLTQDGWAQAYEAGRRLRKLLRPDDTLHFFTSPYRRTRETTEGILSTLTADNDPADPSPFQRQNIKVYEEPRLREQDFGNFQPCSAEMERMWQERADYGHFFYRIPNGESAADAYDRVSGFNESLWRQFSEDDFASVCVLVTHGLMSRVFLMKWYHFTVEYFEDLRNVNHCEFLIMRKEENGKYTLENNLRTWSELRRERALKEAKADGNGAAATAAASRTSRTTSSWPKKPERANTFVPTRRWGGCPNGCNHGRYYKRSEDLEVLRQKDIETSILDTTAMNTSSSSSSKRQRQQHQHQHEPADSSDEDVPNGRSNNTKPPALTPSTGASHSRNSPSPVAAINDPLPSPDLVLRHPHYLHVGRDFGGTYSGHASTAGSDTDASEDDYQRHRRIASLDARVRNATGLVDDNNNNKSSEDSNDTETVVSIETQVQAVIVNNRDDQDQPNLHHLHHHHHLDHELHRALANRLGDATPTNSDDEGGDVVTDKDKDITTTTTAVANNNNDNDNRTSTFESEQLEEDLNKAEEEDRSIQGSVY